MLRIGKGILYDLDIVGFLPFQLPQECLALIRAGGLSRFPH